MTHKISTHKAKLLIEFMDNWKDVRLQDKCVYECDKLSNCPHFKKIIEIKGKYSCKDKI